MRLLGFEVVMDLGWVVTLAQPLRNPLCDLVLVVGAADHASHVV
jgi:hypothetical protein